MLYWYESRDRVTDSCLSGDSFFVFFRDEDREYDERDESLEQDNRRIDTCQSEESLI